MVSKRAFLFHLYFEAALTGFFIFLAVQLLPIRGWEFSTIFCCVFATASLVNVIKMIQTYWAFKIIQQAAAHLSNNNNDDDDDVDILSSTSHKHKDE